MEATKPINEKMVGADSSKKADKTPTQVKVTVKRKPVSNRGIVITK